MHAQNIQCHRIMLIDSLFSICFILLLGVQIHNVDGNHWVVSSSLDRELKIFDSKFGGGSLSEDLQWQIALIYRTMIERDEDGEECDPQLGVSIPNVQQQSGSSDCGLFAIAFALHSILGDDVAKIEFDQKRMRKHLLKCLINQAFEPFPTLAKISPRNKYYPGHQVLLYCTCEMPEKEIYEMVACDECDNWYHLACIGLNKLPSAAEEWICPNCKN